MTGLPGIRTNMNSSPLGEYDQNNEEHGIDADPAVYDILHANRHTAPGLRLSDAQLPL